VEQDPELVYTDLGAVEDDVDGTIKCMGICNTCITTDLHLPNEIESAGTTTDESAAVFKKPAVRNLEDIVNKNFNQWTKPATNSATAILVKIGTILH
jgi:hypothetical protein